MSKKKATAIILITISAAWIFVGLTASPRNGQQWAIAMAPPIVMLLIGLFLMPKKEEELMILDEMAIKIYRDMMTSGLITESEYETLRKRVIERTEEKKEETKK